MRLPFQRPRAEPAVPPHGSDDALQAARTQARRRLVGAVVLLIAGVIGFPILFETQPRPVAIDTPIVAPGAPGTPSTPPRRESVPEPVAEPVPAAEPASASRATAPVAEVASAATGPVAGAAQSDPDATAAAPAAPTVSAKPAPSTRPTASTTSAANARPVAPAATAKRAPEKPAAAEGRFVVQVGAYTDPGTLRDTRGKVEKLGLKTYTQVLDSPAGRRTRLRVGPFATRAEAQAAAARLKAAGMPAAILAL